MSDVYLDKLVKKYGHRVFAKYGGNTPATATYIGRPTIFGNPITLGDIHDVDERIRCAYEYRQYLFDRISTDTEFVNALVRLRGCDVTCWCSNGTSHIEEGARYCHGHILLAAVDYLVKNK